MGYRHTLLKRWSQRDKLAIVVIAVTVGFLTGTTLVIAAASTQTTSIAQEYGSNQTAMYYDSISVARTNVEEDALVIPVAMVTLQNGETRYVAGLSKRQVKEFKTRTDVSLSPPPKMGVTSGTRYSKGQQHLVGEQTHRTVTVTPRPSSHQLIPSSWYVANSKLVERLGISGAFVVTSSNESTGIGTPKRVVPLQSALAFFVTGTRQLLTVLSVIAVGGAILVGVTIYSVTRMTVRDRIQTIRVLRSTGCRLRTVVQLFALRAGLLTSVGIGVGYAIGMILPHIAVNLAVFAGLPSALTLRLSRLVLTVLIPIYGGTVFVALVAGTIATWPAINSPPSRLSDSVNRKRSPQRTKGSGVHRFFRLRLLDWRAVAPSTATLAVFVTVVLLVTSLAGVLSPLMSTQGTTITEPGAPHPMASNVPQQYASTLRSEGVPASAEILLFTMRNGQPIVVRGANFSAFTTVSNVTIEDGRQPNSTNEAVVGVDLARTSGIEIGDRIMLGGSTEPGIALVRVVGTYSASGVTDDQLLVSLPIGQHLVGKTGTTVQMIRTTRQFEQNTSASSVEIINVSAPNRVNGNESVPIRVQLRNFGSEKTTHTISSRLGATSKSVSVTLEPNSQRSVTLRFPAPRPGKATLRVGGFTKSVHVTSPNSIQMQGVPARAPPNSAPRITVSTMDGKPIADATIHIANTTIQTGSNGTARLPLDSTGSYTVHVMARNQTVTQTINVSRAANRIMTSKIKLRPSNPSILSQTEARVQLSNPWNTTLTRRLSLSGDINAERRTVSLTPGERRTEVFSIGEQAPGSYSIRVISDEHQLAATSYTVSGDKRLIAAYANSGRPTSGTGIGQALRTAFGNLQLVFAVLVLLAGIMTVGSTTAVFAQAVQARRRMIGIYRATGAKPTRVLRLIIADAITIGCVAISGALLLGSVVILLLAKLDYLIIFGIRISPVFTPSIILGNIIGGLTITFLSASLIAGTFLIRQPATLVRNDVRQNEKSTVMIGRDSDD